MIFQLTEWDVQYNSSLSKRDIGKWCYLVNGCYHGFHKTREAAEQGYAGAIPYRKLKPEIYESSLGKEPGFICGSVDRNAGWRLVSTKTEVIG